MPYVQKKLDLTRWGIHALENRPDVSGEVPSASGLPYYASEDHKITKFALPLLPDYNLEMVATASSSGTANAAYIYNYVSKWADIQDPKAVEYSEKETEQYRELQAQHELPNEVQDLMRAYCSAQTLQRFDDAKKAYFSSKSGIVTRRDVATAIRNTLDGIKGDLFEKVRTPIEQKATWPKIYQRLAKGVKDREILTKNDAVRVLLYKNLTDVLKDREHGSATDLDNLWTQTLDFMYTVLNLLKPVS